MLTGLRSLALVKRVPLNAGQPGHVNLVLAGCGGTGSILAWHLARLAYHARQRGIALHVTFVDPDVIELKNVGRQNFVEAELGRCKAETLAARYSLAYGLQIRFFNAKLAPDHAGQVYRRDDGWLHLVVGAVDNTAARQEIEAIVKAWDGRLWWLDCGNHDLSGQVVLGNRGDLKAPEISPLGFCTGLPLPSVQHPELVRKKRRRRASCADAALIGEQSLLVNQQVAGWAAVYLYRLLVTRDLDIYATYFDLAAGSVRSEGISREITGESAD
jgi:PRTRC genetic system ThiF family protein